jgi:hypothetical protein
MIRRIATGMLLIAVTGLTWSFVRGEPRRAPADQPPEAALMRAKVASSHKIMEGLVARDFKEIHEGAAELKRICRATEWQAHSDPIYAHYRNELVRQANKLIEAAGQSNTDSATFAYMNTLTTCINCHDHCRDVLKIANVRRPTKVIPIPTTDGDDSPAGEEIERR